MKDLFIRSVQILWEEIAQESYLRSIAALSFCQALEFEKNVTFFAGENGSGKSTLLEGIAVAYGFKPEGGSRNYRFSTFDSHSPLHGAIRLAKGARRPRTGYFLRAESFYNVASKAEDYRDGDAEEAYYAQMGGRSLHCQSHGESFLALIQGYFQPDGLYLLDEPEAALSPSSQLVLLLRLQELSRQGAQFIIATHSPILLGLPKAQILCFDGGCIKPCRYEQTESYRVTELFINHRERVLRNLFYE